MLSSSKTSHVLNWLMEAFQVTHIVFSIFKILALINSDFLNQILELLCVCLKACDNETKNTSSNWKWHSYDGVGENVFMTFLLVSVWQCFSNVYASLSSSTCLPQPISSLSLMSFNLIDVCLNWTTLFHLMNSCSILKVLDRFSDFSLVTPWKQGKFFVRAKRTSTARVLPCDSFSYWFEKPIQRLMFSNSWNSHFSLE